MVMMVVMSGGNVTPCAPSWFMCRAASMRNTYSAICTEIASKVGVQSQGRKGLGTCRC
jgi:hypothetical protein